MKIKDKILLVLLILLVPVFILFCIYYSNYTGRAYAVSVSSNGHYAVSSTFGNKLLLWNLQDHDKKLISQQVKIYSAYFIKGTDYFVWYDLANQIHIENIHGKSLKLAQLSQSIRDEITRQNLNHFLLKKFYTTNHTPIKYIDLQGHYLRFKKDFPYAILYTINTPKPLKKLPLGTKPYPSLNSDLFNKTIATAPKTHILVTGQAYGSGINVYQFNSQTLTLKKIWTPK